MSQTKGRVINISHNSDSFLSGKSVKDNQDKLRVDLKENSWAKCYDLLKYINWGIN